MGTYIYALKKSLRKNAILEGQKVQIDAATYAYKPSMYGQDYDTQDFGLKMWLDKAANTPKEEQAPYLVLTSGDGSIDGCAVHKNNKYGVWSDGNGHYSGLTPEDIIGRVYKIGNRYHVVPKDQDLDEFIKSNFPKVYSKPLPHTQMYVKMTEGYTATVRDIKSLKEYLDGYGDVSRSWLNITGAGDDVPQWFQDIVRTLVDNKKRELNHA